VLLDSPLVPGWGSVPWAGVVWPDARAPAGWGRELLRPGPHGRGHAAASLTPGDVVEFGADERRPAGRRRWVDVPRRWYGVVLATGHDHLVAWGPFPAPGPAWECAQAALARWRQAAHVEVAGVTDTTTATPPVDPGRGRPELTAATGPPVVEVRTSGGTTRVDDPVHGPIVIDAAVFGAGMAAPAEVLAARLRRDAPGVALTGHESHATLAALAALHTAPDPTSAATASPGPVYAASPAGVVEVRDERGAPLRLIRPAGRWTPDGFGWGYDGDGPTELAYALLADATASAELARRLAPRYTTEVTSRLPSGQPWTLPVSAVRAWAANPALQQPVPAAEVGL
jgi:hypothetical protein